MMSAYREAFSEVLGSLGCPKFQVQWVGSNWDSPESGILNNHS